MFPDSKIASKYGCARTKTGALIRNENSTETMKFQPFSLATDGSNNINDTKLYPIVVSYFVRKLNCVGFSCDNASTMTDVFKVVSKSENTCTRVCLSSRALGCMKRLQ
ncbi:hypothetical protein PR048_005930 [Dryococelus australis]|uniref:DUF4371 domain-containing protein n=1 Tax=Dryococelus australis TaxID=614101 RepID=A0ABQ9I9K4_9NEOP|nr:hypothetical protein PR048_005930 [Dryococelus australis]